MQIYFLSYRPTFDIVAPESFTLNQSRLAGCRFSSLDEHLNFLKANPNALQFDTIFTS
jgi:hypothetical protein